MTEPGPRHAAPGGPRSRRAGQKAAFPDDDDRPTTGASRRPADGPTSGASRRPDDGPTSGASRRRPADDAPTAGASRYRPADDDRPSSGASRYPSADDSDPDDGTGPAGTRPMPVVGPGTPREYEPGPPREAGDRPPGHARRFWSSRRVPATITALLALAGTGLMLYDVSAVRAGRHAMRWRVRLADELASRPLDDTWVITGAAVAAALGLWLLALALTPGLRQVLPLRPGPGRIRAGLDRDAAALVLRDRALEVPGVRAVRVAVSRRRAKVRADSHFRELADVRRDLDTVLDEAGRGFGLDRELRMSVLVRRAAKG